MGTPARQEIRRCHHSVTSPGLCGLAVLGVDVLYPKVPHPCLFSARQFKDWPSASSAVFKSTREGEELEQLTAICQAVDRRLNF